MTWAAINQAALALLGLAGTYASLHQDNGIRRWGPILGLASQPFWFASAIPQGQWGMVLLCCTYTTVYLRAVCAQLHNSNS